MNKMQNMWGGAGRPTTGEVVREGHAIEGTRVRIPVLLHISSYLLIRKTEVHKDFRPDLRASISSALKIKTISKFCMYFIN